MGLFQSIETKVTFKIFLWRVDLDEDVVYLDVLCSETIPRRPPLTELIFNNNSEQKLMVKYAGFEEAYSFTS